MTSQVAPVVKNVPANAGDARDTGSLPGLGRFPGVGNGTPLQHSCLENSIGIGTWGSTVYGDTKNQTRLSDRANTHTHTIYASGYPRTLWILSHLILTTTLGREQ